MTQFVIELWMDGYETEDEHIEACLEYIEECLNSSAVSIKVLKVVDKKLEV